MGEKITEEVLKRIDALAAKLGVVAEHLWEVLVRQAAIDGYVHLAWAAVLFVISTVLVTVSYRLYKRAMQNDTNDGPGYGFCAVMFFLLGLLCFLGGSVGNVMNAISELANPEFAALKLLIGGN
jgi:cytochrome bd-type quinol oxidase subunit 1